MFYLYFGSSRIEEHFVDKLGLEAKNRFANQGYLIDCANSIGITAASILFFCIKNSIYTIIG